MAYAFASAGNYFTATRNYNVSDFTVGVWLYKTTGLTGTVVACWTNTAGTQQWLIQSNASGNFTFVVRDDVAGVNRVGITTTAISLSTWCHVALRKDSSNLTCFVNGVQEAQTSAPNAMPSVTNAFAIGGRSDSTARFDGYLAEFATWTSALDASEIASLADGFKPSRVKKPDINIPLVRNVVDTAGAYAITTNGTPTVTAHPRVY